MLLKSNQVTTDVNNLWANMLLPLRIARHDVSAAHPPVFTESLDAAVVGLAPVPVSI